ncbi:MAG TPA: phosphotransferase [Candidatus Baltobacteraceae bacterium]|nr:phosphotransferase [Candidatus Baltobacteraceae bacterium]
MDKPIWTADIGIDALLAAELLAAQFPQFSDARVEPLCVGWDNAAFLVEGHTVFRFPRRRVASGLIERENAILPHLAPMLPLAIPIPSFIGAASPKYPWAFAGYKLIEGTSASECALADEMRVGLAEPLALFLQALHRVDPAPFTARGLPSDERGRLDHDLLARRTSERLIALAEDGITKDPDGILASLTADFQKPIDDYQRRIVHGDLYARHILLDAKDRPTGVIDWGDIHLGDPAIDIAIAHLVLPPSSHATFREAYGFIDERTWNAARSRAIYHAVLELDYGVKANDAGMREIGSAALRLMNANQSCLPETIQNSPDAADRHPHPQRSRRQSGPC